MPGLLSEADDGEHHLAPANTGENGDRALCTTHGFFCGALSTVRHPVLYQRFSTTLQPTNMNSLY